MTYQNLLKDYLSIEHRIQLYKTIWGGTYLYEFLVKSLLITNMITLPTVWVSIKCLTY